MAQGVAADAGGDATYTVPSPRCRGEATRKRHPLTGALGPRGAWIGSTVITSGTAFAPPVVVGMSDSAIGVYDGGANTPEPTAAAIRTFDSDGAETGRHPVPGGAELPGVDLAHHDIEQSDGVTDERLSVFQLSHYLVGVGCVASHRVLLPRWRAAARRARPLS